ncbi:MAG: hypothetical protein RR327_04115 [Clostridia bacterium]
MDFRSYKNEPQALNFDEEAEMQDVIAQYNGMSQNELESKLKEMFEKERAEGKMDMEKLNDMMQNMNSFLDDEQKAKLKNLISKLQ